jgi:hypothetical protein
MPRPETLPVCAYPTAADAGHHGLQPLPDELHVADPTGAERYRSRRHRTTRTTDLADAQLVQLAEVVGDAFSRLEPMARHLRPGRPPAGLRDAIHRDPLGTADFGPWTASQILIWFVRLLALTDPTSPRADIAVNEDVLSHSLAVVDEAGVGHHFMIARGHGLPRDDTFELVAATMEHFRHAGFRYVVVEASKQWTGAACEALGGVGVHFAPFRTRAVVPIDGGGTTSPDGFISDKDSGCMFYLLRLA